MNNQSISISRNALNTAIPVGGALILLSVLFYVFDVEPRSYWTYLTYVVLVAGMIWGTVTLRNKHHNGDFSYGNAFLSCLLIGTFSAIISNIYSFIFYKYIAPEQIGKLMEIAEEQTLERAPQLTDEQLEAAMSMSEKFMTPLGISIFALFSIIIISLVLALILAIFLKKNATAKQVFANIEE
ncbi:MAG: DUF4199 domain-containing protein [Bacteroidales bacterium]|nr:DUF4199 domain-containing protein [Bacteroidales bacterium]MDZ4205556.1 DUF4199 domain-containing protein [Bacteroidales bacterium]